MFGEELIKSCIGHRIGEYKDLVNYNGISVFYDGNKTYSKDGWALPEHNHIFESYSMREFIDKFPQFADFVIVKANEFFNEYVFRIREMNKKEFVKACIGHRINEYESLEHFDGIVIFYNGKYTFLKEGWESPLYNRIYESNNIKDFLNKFPEFTNFIIDKTGIYREKYIFRLKREDEYENK